MNNTKLLIASFLTIFVAGLGFAVRGGLLLEWGKEFGFTQTELGQITGGGFVGFGIVILIASLFLDRFGYKPFLMLAGILHVLSVIITVAATFVYSSATSRPTRTPPARGPTSACSGGSSSSRSRTASVRPSSIRWSPPSTASRRRTTSTSCTRDGREA